MKIKDILEDKGSTVWTIRSNQTIQDTIHLLAKHKIGALLVTDDSLAGVVGMIGERDIIEGCNRNWKSLDRAYVRDWMNRTIVTCGPDEDVREVMALMTRHKARHIPIVENGEVQGLVSIGDVVKMLIEDSEYQLQFLKEYVFGNYD